MNQSLRNESIFYPGPFGNNLPIWLPREERERLERQKQKREEQLALEQAKAEIEKIRQETAYQLQQQKLLFEQAIKEPPKAILSKVEKLSFTPTQIKEEVKNKQQEIEEQEQLHDYLNRKPTKPAENLLKKLIKKQTKTTVSSKVKKQAQAIYDIENKLDTNEAQNDKILEAIKSMHV
jgi:hypothetical protein